MNTTAPDTATILKKYFPIKLASGYEILSATREECFACVKEHARTIFGPSSNRYILASESRTDANRGMQILKLRANYFLSGFELTERWGPMFKAVKLLHEDRRKNFVENFGEANHL